MGIKREGLRELALFAGVGGGILGGHLLGWTTVCAVENDPYCINVLLQRQKDECLPRFPIWDDIRTFDGRPFRGHVDVITGGFPCTDISCAGKGEGITGKNSKLFFEMLRIIEEIRPQFVFAENAKELRTKGLGIVLTGLARLGYDARWGVLGARHIGANHWRKRMWVVASDTHGGGERVEPFDAKMEGASTAERMAGQPSHPDSERGDERGEPRRIETPKPNVKSAIFRGLEEWHTADSNCESLWEQSRGLSRPKREETPFLRITSWWDIPRFAGVDDRGPNRVDRVRTTGNAQVPGVAALAWHILSEGLGELN